MSDDILLKTAALKVLSEFTKAKYDEARKEAAEVLRRGDRRQVYSPLDGTKIGPVYMTDPKTVSVVTDEAALTAWMVEHYPEQVESGYKVMGSDEEIVSVLFVHAPHLLKRIKKVKRAMLAQIHADSLAVGQPMGPNGELDLPGIALETPEPQVACRPTEDAELAVMELVHNQRLYLDGTEPKQVEA